MEKQARTPLERFLSLSWYDTLLRFASTFVAKSSEVLLTIGLVVSSANFLTDGSIVKQGTILSLAWAWIQSIAIDGSLGTSFYRVLTGIKERDWITCIFSAILTILLTGVAWITVEGDTLSHAANTSIEAAMHMIGIDVRLLSLLRAIAVVGVVLMSRLHEVSFRERDSPTRVTSLANGESSQQAPVCSQCHTNAPQQVLEERASSTAEVAVVTTATSQEQTVLLDQPQEKQEPQQASDSEAQTVRSDPAGDQQEQITPKATSFLAAYDERLRAAYDALQVEGEKITGRALAQRVHVRRSTCTAWLRSRRADIELHLQKKTIEASGENQTTP